MKVVRGYHHHDGSIGVMARFEVGSDFTSRTPEFKKLADDLLMSFALHWRDQSQGALLRVGNPLADTGTTSWIGDDFDTVRDALEAASKLFKEPITLDEVVVVFDGVDRAPRRVREDAH